MTRSSSDPVKSSRMRTTCSLWAIARKITLVSRVGWMIFRIWNRTITADEVQSLFDSAPAPSTGPIAATTTNSGCN